MDLQSRQSKVSQDRLKRNQEIADEVKSGTFQQAAFNKEMSWFPRRPPLSKDLRALNALYGEKSE